MMATSLHLSNEIIDLRDVVDLLDESDEDGGDVARAIMAGFIEDGLCADRDDFERYAQDEPVLIAAAYFEDYARQLAEDVGAVSDDTGWPGRHIDWAAAANELKYDYSSVDVVDPDDPTSKVEYFIRSV